MSDKSNGPSTAGGRELGLAARPPAQSNSLSRPKRAKNHPHEYAKRLQNKYCARCVMCSVQGCAMRGRISAKQSPLTTGEESASESARLNTKQIPFGHLEDFRGGNPNRNPNRRKFTHML